MPFTEVLESLTADESPPIHLLYRLSDMDQEDLVQFEDRWQRVSEERRRIIVRHLVDIGEEDYLVDFIPVFNLCLSDPAASVRATALDGLWDTTNTALIDPVLTLLQDDASEEVRASAASALAHFVLMAEWQQLPESILPPIVDALIAEHERPGNELSVRRATLEALAASSDHRVPELIDAAYEDAYREMQISAIFAMGGSADPRWIPLLLEEMNSHSAEMRAEAARAAGSIGDESATSELTNLMIDEELEVAQAAIEALGQIGGEQASEALSQLRGDPEFEALHESLDRALDEIGWLGGLSLSFDFSPEVDELE